MINCTYFPMEQIEQNIEPKKISVGRNAMNYGALTGVALIIVSLIFYILNMTLIPGVQWIQFAVYVAGMIIGILNYRNKVNGGFISYGKSLGSGVLIGLFASIIASIYVYILFKFIDPGLVDKMISMQEDAILKKSPDISDEDMELIMDKVKIFMAPFWMAIMGVVMNTLYSFILSLIISIFTRKTDKSFEANFR